VYPGAHAKAQPDKPALIMASTGRTITYAELDERSNRLAQWWYDAGLRTGDGVAMLVTNVAETLEIYWAAIRSGLYVTAINYNLSADEASYIVNDANVRSLIVNSDVADLAKAVAAQCPGLGSKLSI
jgi:fatty-acyl-CoA synthase